MERAKQDDDQVVNPDERIGLSDLGVGMLAMENAHRAMTRFEVVQPALLQVIRHALIFQSTWRRCYPSCVCSRCELFLAVGALVRAINARDDQRA